MQDSNNIVAVVDIGSNTSLLLIARLSNRTGSGRAGSVGQAESSGRVPPAPRTLPARGGHALGLDQGSNSIRIKDKEIEILEDRLFYTRLAEGFAKTKNPKYIKTSALKRQAQFFKTAQKLIHQYSIPSGKTGREQKNAHTVSIKCVATAASRQAHNKEELILLGKKYGFPIEIISPEEEAKWSRTGALFHLPVDPKKAVVLDIGGASTEISSEQNVCSLPIGSVNLTELFLHHNPSTQPEINLLEKHIKQEIKKIPFSFSKKSVLVATAGTPTTLASLQNQTNHWPKLHGVKLNLQQVDKWYQNLLWLSVEERKQLKGMPIYRADVMPAGLSLLKQIMCHFCWKQCVVSVTGLRFGLLHPYLTSIFRRRP